jgi:hypothetical protein
MLFRARFRTRTLGFLPMCFLLDRRTSWLRPFRMRSRGHPRLDRARMLHLMLFRMRRGLRHGMLLLSLGRVHGLLLPWLLPWLLSWRLRLVRNWTPGTNCRLVAFNRRPWHAIFSG